MTNLKLAGQPGALDATPSNAEFREQIAALTDMMRQMGGNASVVAGALAQADPLSAPFTLYVNPYTGSDKFVGGSYNTHEVTGTDEEIIESKLKRIESQRLECGYSPFRPFRTINRAAIEAAIITSKSWYTYNDPRAHVDCVTIVLSGGVHIVYNDPGSASTSLASWSTEKDPTTAELIEFNPVTGGLLLPRGCSMHGQDLRKTSVRPNWVTSAIENELPDYSNRRSIFKVSGTGFFFNATTMDKIGHAESCHLLDSFQPASKEELDDFYAKVESAVGSGADLASALLVTRPSEYQIAGPIDQTQAPTSAWDTTNGASPYIFNWSVRSDYGIGGAFWDGSKLQGLRSMVCANFTGTNIQKDMRAWQVYESGNWVSLNNTPIDYQKYIDANPDDVRRNPLRQTRHISAINDAYIQKVSIFGIGQSEVTMVDNGGEITDNTGNSTFGGNSALAKGYKQSAFPVDQNWTVSRIKSPLNVSEKTGNIRRIYIGTVSAVSSSMITLSTDLAVSSESATVPAILLKDNYSLAAGTRIWVENPIGTDWRATLTSTAWDSGSPDEINIAGQLLQSGTDAEVGNNPQGVSLAIGRRVYVRRIIDTRTPSERRISLLLNNTASVRLPQRNTVLQTDPARSGGAISRVLDGGGDEVLLVTAVGIGPMPGAGVSKTAELTIRRGAADRAYASGVYYPIGAVVRHAGKHWQAKVAMVATGASPEPSKWGECYVHMPSAFNPEDNPNNEAPILTFDTDTSDDESSVTLGIDWVSIWTTAGIIRQQYRSGTDYLGAYALLIALGFDGTAAHDALVPQVSESRLRDPNSVIDFPVAPAGGAATGLGYWAVEFRRPSTIRLYNHQWEWAGFGNYSKALPSVQKDMSEFNKFTYYFTSAVGGRVTPKGSNEDGFEVTPRGLEDIATGATTTLENLGGQDIDAAQTQDFVNIYVSGTATVQDLKIDGVVEFPDSAKAKTTNLGIGRLASYNQVKAVPSDENFEIASSDAAIDANPDLITIQSLNRWRIAQQLVSTRDTIIPIYVSATAVDRNLDSMFETQPNTPATAVPTLARAAEYANALIGSGNQTAEVRIEPGVYEPASTWECNVKFVAYTANFTAKRWPSNSTSPNNFFDGSEYGDFTSSTTNGVQFQSFAIALRPASQSANDFHINCLPRPLIFNKSFSFEGGFHFLGIAQIIKAVSLGRITRESFVYKYELSQVIPPLSDFETDLDTNVDTFLNSFRILNGRDPAYDSWTTGGLFRVRGTASDQCIIRDCVFGPGLPSHKDSLGGTRDPLIVIDGSAEAWVHNIYFRGKTTITTTGMFNGVANGSISDLPQADLAHYGSAAISAPWTWSQTYHTFIGSVSGKFNDINIRLGSTYRVGAIPALNYYEDASLPPLLLANHIHLLTVNGAKPVNNVAGPYFDQFIHAPAKLSASNVWPGSGETIATAGNRMQGFVGKFGSNEYNDVKTRGVLGGNIGVADPETGFTFNLPPGAGANNARSLFQKAGIPQSDADSTARPVFNLSSPITVTLNTSTEEFSAVKHGLSAGDSFVFNVDSGTAPSHPIDGQTYYVISDGLTPDKFKASDTLNGPSININGTVTGDYSVTPIIGPGDGAPAGDNPVITTDGSAGLNVALRSYLRGISVTRAITIPSSNVIL